MRVLPLLTAVTLIASSCGGDPTDASGDYPYIEGNYVGAFQEAGTSGNDTSLFACDMRIEVHGQNKGVFLADFYFLQGGDCAQEGLWSQTSGHVELNGDVRVGWDYSDQCASFSGDTEMTGHIDGNTLVLSASFDCDGWTYADSYTGTKD